MRSGRLLQSRCQTRARPMAIRAFLEHQTVMQAGWTPLPEFDHGRPDQEPTPMGRTGYFTAGKLNCIFFHQPFQFHTSSHFPALR